MTLQMMRLSIVNDFTLDFRFLCLFSNHPMQAKDRFGNENIDFPIGFAFGDDDWNRSDGVEELVKNNKHFATGRSQIFLIKGSKHEIHSDQLKELVRTIFGFLDGSITGRLENVRWKRLPEHEFEARKQKHL